MMGSACSDGLVCNPGVEKCRYCSFYDCQKFAILSNWDAFSYKGTGLKWCRQCNYNDLSSLKTSEDWGTYAKGIH